MQVDEKAGSGSGATYFPAAIITIGSFSKRIALPLFIFGALLLLPGIYCQKKIDSKKFMDRALRNSLRSMAMGFLLIPGYILFYYLALALTAFIHD